MYNTESAMLWAGLIFWLIPMAIGFSSAYIYHKIKED